jgi:hypothetical protein
MSFAERLANPLVLGGQVTQRYASEDGTCKQGKPGGFQLITLPSDTLGHPVVDSPEGVFFSRSAFFGNSLPFGADTSGSMVLTVNVTDTPGEFEIDTTCVDPANHLIFSSLTGTPIYPRFTKGIIVIGHPVVSSLADSGSGSLRNAIGWANSHSGPDTISFDSAIAGPIYLKTPLPAITDAGGGTTILGFTAKGAASPHTPTVVLAGDSCTPGAGLTIQSAQNKIEGLTFHRFKGAGVAVTGGVSNTITACRFSGNTGQGIDLGNDGIITENGLPVFGSVFESSSGNFTVYGTAAPNARVELYLASQPDSLKYPPENTSHGPAYRFLNSKPAASDGAFAFSAIQLPEWSQVTATATYAGNTSEFARNQILPPGPLTVTVLSDPVSLGTLSMSPPYPAVQVLVFGPPDSNAQVDTIGPSINTFALAEYDSTKNVDGTGDFDARVTINRPDTGIYRIRYHLVGTPGTYLTEIVVGFGQPIRRNITFTTAGDTDSTTLDLTPPDPDRGDLVRDGVIDVFDVIAAIEIVFSGAPMPVPPGLVDVNCDGVADVFDVIYLIDYTFSGGPAPCA